MAADESLQQVDASPMSPNLDQTTTTTITTNVDNSKRKQMIMELNSQQIRDKMRSLEANKQPPMATMIINSDNNEPQTGTMNESNLMHVMRQTGMPTSMSSSSSINGVGAKSPTSGQQSRTPTSAATKSNQWQTVASSSATISSPARARMTSTSGAAKPAEPASQVERPAGYSYESPASSTGNSYTHTSQLSPIKQEIMMAEQAGGAATSPARQRQLNYAGSSTGRASPSSSSVNQIHQVEQVKFPAVQQPQFTSGAFSQLPPPPPFRQAQQQAAGHVGLAGPAQSSVTGTPLNPCKPFHQQQVTEQQQNSIQLLPNELLVGSASSINPMMVKYLRAGSGTRLRSQYIFKVIRADSLTDCELACTRASQLAGGNQYDTCRSFNYRPYFAAENCELSRYDLSSGTRRPSNSPTDTNQLKLDDPAQFEQHTQFDFYALASEPPTAASQSMLIGQPSQQQIQQQQLYSPFGSLEAASAAECLDVSQSCSQDGTMEFTLRTQEPFNGRIYTYGFYDSCFVDGDGSTSSSLKISRSNGFPRCGTQLIGGELMTNIVVVQFNDYVQTTRDKKYNLTCYFSGPGEAVVTSNYLDTKVDERSHPIQIEHLPPQNVITSNVHLRVLYRGQPTNTIAVGDLLTFRLETGSTGGPMKQQRAGDQLPLNNEIFATNVIAKDPYSGRQVQLIDARGCPVDAVNVFPELQRTPDGALESEFYAFKIPDSNFLIFQATVRTCKSPCEPVICHSASSSLQVGGSGTGGGGAGGSLSGTKSGGSSASLGAYLMAPHQSSAPSWGRRRRRQADEHAEGQTDELQQPVGAGELMVSGESVEHIIPARLGSPGDGHRSGPAGVRTIVNKRPDLSEAEEEVKEMFRVYLSRAEINQKQRQQVAVRQPAVEVESLARPEEPARPALANRAGLLSSRPDFEEPGDDLRSVLLQQQQQVAGVCLTQVSYYVLLFSIISLSLIIVSILIVFAYISRRAKFHISEALADSIF